MAGYPANGVRHASSSPSAHLTFSLPISHLQYVSLLLAAPDPAVVLAALQTLAACVRKSSAPTAR